MWFMEINETEYGNAAAYAAQAVTADGYEDDSASAAAITADIASSYGAYATDAGASVVFLRTLSIDATHVDQGAIVAYIADSPLWPGDPPPEIVAHWTEMKRDLLAFEEDWDVWTDWYEERLAGKRSNKKLEIARATIPNEIWEEGPAVVNAHIKRLIAEHTPPSQPSPEPGLRIEVTDRGLEAVPQQIGSDFDEALQRALHGQLQRLFPLLKESTHRVANAHPVLDLVTSEYSELVAVPFDSLDVASLWAVGTGLLALSDTFTTPPPRMMSQPLEPGHLAQLQQAAQIHGAFILGFPLGRELTTRADQARLSRKTLAEIGPHAHHILDRLRHAVRFVEARTREFITAVDECLIELGWEGTRTGYAGYAVTKNILIALGQVLTRAEAALSSFGGGIALNVVDPGYVYTSQIIAFVLENVQPILAFAAPFPELKHWLIFLIDHIDMENK